MINFLPILIFIGFSANASDLKFPFQRVLNSADQMSLKNAACAKSTDELFKAIQMSTQNFKDLEIFRAIDKSDENAEKTFSFLPLIPKDLEGEFSDGTEGLMIPGNEPRFGLKKSVIVMSETAAPYDLAHEFGHYLLLKSLGPQRQQLVAQRYRQISIERNLSFKIGRFYNSSENLKNHFWRLDVLSSIFDYAQGIGPFSRSLIIEEVIIETQLAKEALACRSPLFTKSRGLRGIRYARSHLLNIRLRYETVHSSLLDFKQSVLHNPDIQLSLREIETILNKFEEIEQTIKPMESEMAEAKALIDQTEALIKNFAGP